MVHFADASLLSIIIVVVIIIIIIITARELPIASHRSVARTSRPAGGVTMTGDDNRRWRGDV